MDELNYLFQRDLDKLIEEISLYSNDENLWKKLEGTSNSGGNLALHICGNLQHFIGAVLGESGYVRNRDFEFTGTGATKEALMAEVQGTKEILQSVIPSIKQEDQHKIYPAPPDSYPGFTILKLLIHLYGHLSYHLGQINYHRRFFCRVN